MPDRGRLKTHRMCSDGLATVEAVSAPRRAGNTVEDSWRSSGGKLRRGEGLAFAAARLRRDNLRVACQPKLTLRR